jgi:hypothetical protein
MIIYSPTFTGSVQITGSQTVTGDLTVQGNLTAQTFILSSSVSYFTESFASGSTRFGDSADDNMIMTGSFKVSGSTGGGFIITGSTGYVGIGTSTPSNLLNIVGANYIFNLSGGGASRIAGAVNNTAGNLEWGLEGSTGNQLFTGAAAYTANIGTSNNTSFNLCTNTNVRMIISGSGQIGIGTAPSAWSTGNSIKPIQNPAGTFWNFDVGNLYVGLNYYYDGTNRRYVNSSEYATEYQQNGSHIFFTAPVGTAGNVVTLTERMRISNAGVVSVNSYAAITGGTFDVPASTTKTVTVAFNGGNIHAFLGFSSQSGGITGSGAKSIFLGGTTNDGSGHTPTVLSTFSYGDQVVGAACTNTSAGFTFTIQNNKGSAVSYSWSAFGSFSSVTVS